MERMFRQKLFDGCIWIAGGEVLCDSSLYAVSWEGNWREEGRFQETEWVLEQGGGEYWVVIGSALPWLGEDNYLFSVQEVTEVHRETAEFVRQFTLIWFLFVAAASLLGAAAAKLVLKPMGILMRAAGEISRGNYGVRAKVGRRDEIGRLAAAFNLMAEQVESRVRELTLAGEEKERLLGSLAHEMRTPMTVVLGYSDTLLNMKLGEREQRQAIRGIYEQAGYLQRLSAKLMELTALHQNESISMEAQSMEAVLEQVVPMAESRWPDRRFCLETEQDFTLCGDRDLLVSLFVNLLDNGAEASAPGQEIRVTVREEEVLIRDSGKGMTEEALRKICEPFYRAEKSGKEGIGLGLAICEQIVCLHRGKLRFESRAGEGTTVTVSF